MDGKEEEWRKGPWTAEEDKLLSEYVKVHGEGRWTSVATGSGLNRNGKSCRLRWVNYLRPGLKRGHLTPQEEGIVIELHSLWGNKWSTIARYLPGRTDNEIKNYWRTHFKKMKPKRKATTKPDNKTMAATKDHELIMKPCERDSNNDHLGMDFTNHQPSAMAEDQSFLSMVYQDFATRVAPAVEEEDSLWDRYLGGSIEYNEQLLGG